MPKETIETAKAKAKKFFTSTFATYSCPAAEYSYITDYLIDHGEYTKDEVITEESTSQCKFMGDSPSKIEQFKEIGDEINVHKASFFAPSSEGGCICASSEESTPVAETTHQEVVLCPINPLLAIIATQYPNMLQLYKTYYETVRNAYIDNPELVVTKNWKICINTANMLALPASIIHETSHGLSQYCGATFIKKGWRITSSHDNAEMVPMLFEALLNDEKNKLCRLHHLFIDLASQEPEDLCKYGTPIDSFCNTDLYSTALYNGIIIASHLESKDIPTLELAIFRAMYHPIVKLNTVRIVQLINYLLCLQKTL